MGQIFDLITPYGRIMMGIKNPFKLSNLTNFVNESDEKRIVTFQKSDYFCSSGVYPGHNKKCEFNWRSFNISFFNISWILFPKEHQMPFSRCDLDLWFSHANNF